MVNVSDVLNWVNKYPHNDVAGALSDLFAQFPEGLDLASASYYLRKEFEQNDRQIDDRVEVYTFDVERWEDDYSDYSGYDEDGEEGESWYGSEDY